MKLSVIMPSFKEANVIRENLRRTESALKKIGMDYEIILVDDGSKQNICKKVTGMSKKIRAYRYETNHGKGYALKYGFSKSTGGLVTFFDADLDIPPHQIEVLVDYMNRNHTDIVVGSKRHPLSEIEYPTKRKALSVVYQLINKALFGLETRDTQCGIKMFRRKVLETVLPKIVVKKHAFDLELLVIANKHNYQITEAPVEIKYNIDARGLSTRSIYHIFRDTLAIAYRLYIIKQYEGRKK